MAEEIVNKHIKLGIVYKKHREKTPKSDFILFLSWSKVALEPKFHEAMTFDDSGTFCGWEKCEQAPTHPQDSCLLSIDENDSINNLLRPLGY